MIDVRDELPTSEKDVVVMINGNLYDAFMRINEWIFPNKTAYDLGIKTCIDAYVCGQKITHWTYK